MTGRPVSPRMLSVYDGQICCGFIIARGPQGHEAFDTDERSIGLFSNEQDAAIAIWRKARGQP
jgi:hypothetical protein